MKLHLPYRLRAALLACIAAVAPIGTTLTTGSLAGAALLSALTMGQQASAQSFNWDDPTVEDILDHARTFDTDRDTAYYVSVNTDLVVMGLAGVTFELEEDGMISTKRYTSTGDEGQNVYSARLVNCDTGHALVCGGIAFIQGSGLNLPTDDLSLQGDSWLNVTTYGTGTSAWDTVVGGNYSYSGAHTEGKTLSFTGDSHIMLRPADEEQTVSVRNIIGGNFRSAVLGHFDGSSYIYVAPGASVYGSIIGGSTSDFGVADTALGFSQSTNIWIYTPLSTQEATADDISLNVGEASVIGGNAVTNGTAMMGLGGNTNIHIELGATEGEAVFNKRVIGGSYAVAGGVGQQGSVNVSISAPNTVTFSQKIIGGSYISGGAALHEGNINLSLAGGKYMDDVILGGYMAAAGLSITNNGTSSLTVTGGSFSPDKKIVGGIYESTAASTVISNGITLNLSGGTFGSIIGGHYITGTGTVDLANFKTGDITITIGKGAIVNGVILGGSSSERKPAASAQNWEQGAITITLGTGSIINGGVYAAGGCATETTGVTSKFLTESTRVILQNGVTLGDSVTISGGYRNTTSAAQIKEGGERVLELQGVGAIKVTNLENANLIDFDKIDISSSASFTTPDAAFFSRSPIFRKGGAGTLIIADGTTHASTALSVEEGKVSLAGTSALDITVKSGASFQSSHGATLTGTLTMESGSSMVWTGSDMALTIDGAGSITFADDSVTLDISGVNPKTQGYTIDLVEKAGIKDDWSDWSSLTVKASNGYAGILSIRGDVLRVSQVKSGIYWINGDAADPNGNNWTPEDADNFVASLDNPDVRIPLKSNDSVYFNAAGQPTATADGVLAPTIIGDVVVHDLVVYNNTDLHLTVMENNTSSLTVNGAAVATYGSTIGKYGKGTLAVTHNVVDAVENFVLDAGTLVISDALQGEIDCSNIQATQEDTVLSVHFTNGEGNQLYLKDTTATDPNNTFKGELQVTAGKVTTALVADRTYDLSNPAEVTLSGFNSSTAASVTGEGTLVLKDLENYDGSAQLGLTEAAWTGTVLLENVVLNGATFHQLGNANSTVAFDTASGSLGTDDIQSGVHLTGQGLDLSSAPVAGTLRVHGALSGDGPLQLGTNSVTFMGDTESYTGVIKGERELQEDGTLVAAATVTFDNQSLNADGTPNTMSIYNGTFEGQVNVVVADGKGLQLNLPTSIGGDLTIGNNSTLKLTGNHTVSVGGDVRLNNAPTLDLSELNIVRSDTRIINVGGDVYGDIDAEDYTVNCDLKLPEYFEAHGFKLVWNEQKQALMLGNNDIAESANYYRSYGGGNINAQAGATMLDNAYNAMKQDIPDGSDLKQLLRAVDTMINKGQSPQDVLTAASGASATAMGLAFAGDIQRQLRAIRNRTTTMGIGDSEGVVHDVPYFNAWVNVEGDYRKVEDDGLLPGYEMNSWGGTVGMDVDITPNLTCGLAFTAMYGDLEAQSVDAGEGDLNTYYLTAFARYAPSAWVHTLVVSAGLADAEFNRTVSYGSGSYRTSGDTDGFGFGLMYEVGYTIPMNDEGTTALQPVVNITYAHTSIDGYSESGSDMAVNVGDQEMDVFTIGVGLRAQTVVGHNTFNRSALLEGRLLAKFDLGDRSSSASTGLAHYNLPGSTVESAETGAVGLELGLGVTLPVGQNAGSVFIDASLELRSEYTNANATIGYRINF